MPVVNCLLVDHACIRQLRLLRKALHALAHTSMLASALLHRGYLAAGGPCAGQQFDVMVSQPYVDCSIDAKSGELHINQVLQVCLSTSNAISHSLQQAGKQSKAINRAGHGFAS